MEQKKFNWQFVGSLIVNFILVAVVVFSWWQKSVWELEDMTVKELSNYIIELQTNTDEANSIIKDLWQLTDVTQTTTIDTWTQVEETPITQLNEALDLR